MTITQLNIFLPLIFSHPNGHKEVWTTLLGVNNIVSFHKFSKVSGTTIDYSKCEETNSVVP